MDPLNKASSVFCIFGGVILLQKFRRTLFALPLIHDSLHQGTPCGGGSADGASRDISLPSETRKKPYGRHQTLNLGPPAPSNSVLYDSTMVLRTTKDRHSERLRLEISKK
jgi:hypothetical protein